MHKAKHIASYCILFPIINPSFSYCNRVSLFSVTHYILVIYKLLPIFQHLYYFIKPIFPHCSIICPYHSHRLLFVLCLSFLRLTFPLLHSLSLGEGWGEDIFFVFSLSARVARTVFCSSFGRLLFVFCSSFVRLLFVFCSSFRHHTSLTVFIKVEIPLPH